MILTGPEIDAMREAGQIIVEPFDSSLLEQNAYGVHLGDTLIEYEEEIIDARALSRNKVITIPEEGLILHPGRFYLGHTYEKIGGVCFTSELFANRSAATMGIWIQTSAPLGHVGAVIRWTLEICVAQRVRVYPRMLIGKVCFWQNHGVISPYEGRYVASSSVVPSRSFLD
jgi:dCTP deaminase